MKKLFALLLGITLVSFNSTAAIEYNGYRGILCKGVVNDPVYSHTRDIYKMKISFEKEIKYGEYEVSIQITRKHIAKTRKKVFTEPTEVIYESHSENLALLTKKSTYLIEGFDLQFDRGNYRHRYEAYYLNGVRKDSIKGTLEFKRKGKMSIYVTHMKCKMAD